jgi:hypothetical protein
MAIWLWPVGLWQTSGVAAAASGGQSCVHGIGTRFHGTSHMP